MEYKKPEILAQTKLMEEFMFSLENLEGLSFPECCRLFEQRIRESREKVGIVKHAYDIPNLTPTRRYVVIAYYALSLLEKVSKTTGIKIEP